jgi:hypothetical protein
MRTSESGHWNGVAHQGVEMRMACKIEDYAIIGDCETAALVGFLPIALVNTAYMLTSQSRHHRHEAGQSQPAARHPLQADVAP